MFNSQERISTDNMGSNAVIAMQCCRHKYLDNSDTYVNTRIQHRGRYGIYAAEYHGGLGLDGGGNDAYTFSASGSLVFAGKSWGFTRPVYDSFAIVRTGNLEGVRTYLNNHEIGRTNRKGEIIIPDMNSYVSDVVSINDKDVPINYALEDIVLQFSPPWRSGTPIYFGTKKTQAFVESVYLNTDAGEIPVEFAEMVMQDASGTRFLTGHDGEFYLENLPTGRHEVHFNYDQKSYVFYLDIQENDSMVVDLGKVAIEKAD